MKLKLLSVIALLAICGAAPVRAAERLFVLKEALVDPAAPISRGVRQECGLDSLVGSMLFNAARQVSPDATVVAATSEVPPGEKVVVATILAVHGIAGGGWTGAKSITVRADLMQNGQVLGSKVTSRSVNKSFRGIAGDTCMLFAGLVPQLGNDVRFWLAGLPSVSGEPTAAADAPRAQPALLVQVPAEIAADSQMPESFRSECGLPSLVGNQVLKVISESFGGAGATDKPAPDAKGRVLKLSILDLKAENELLKTSREVVVRADLVEGAKLVSTQIVQGAASARRGSKQGSCAILERACAAVGREVGQWLAARLIELDRVAEPAAEPAATPHTAGDTQERKAP